MLEQACGAVYLTPMTNIANHDLLAAALVGFECQLHDIQTRINALKTQLGIRTSVTGSQSSNGRRVSAAARKRMAIAQRRRWAACRKGGQEPNSLARLDDSLIDQIQERFCCADVTAFVFASGRRHPRALRQAHAECSRPRADGGSPAQEVPPDCGPSQCAQQRLINLSNRRERVWKGISTDVRQQWVQVQLRFRSGLETVRAADP